MIFQALSNRSSSKDLSLSGSQREKWHQDVNLMTWLKTTPGNIDATEHACKLAITWAFWNGSELESWQRCWTWQQVEVRGPNPCQTEPRINTQYWYAPTARQALSVRCHPIQAAKAWFGPLSGLYPFQSITIFVERCSISRACFPYSNAVSGCMKNVMF